MDYAGSNAKTVVANNGRLVVFDGANRRHDNYARLPDPAWYAPDAIDPIERGCHSPQPTGTQQAYAN